MKSGRVKGGAAIPAVIGTGRQFRSNLAQPVFNASGKRVKGGSARKIIEITSDDLVQNGGQYKLMGGPAIPMQIVTDRAEKGGAAQVVYPVDILGNYDPTFAGYIYKVLTADEDSGYDPSGLIGFWPRNELSGGVSIDYSGFGHHGAYTVVTLGNAGVPGMGMSAAGFDGATSFNNVLSAALQTVFNGVAGTVLLAIKVFNVGVYSDAISRMPYNFSVDANNYVRMLRVGGVNNRLDFRYSAGGVLLTIPNIALADTDWMWFGLTWDKGVDEVNGFYNGIQVGATLNGLGVWAGNIVVAVLGAQSVVPGAVWHGWESVALLFDEAKSPAEVAYLSTP